MCQKAHTNLIIAIFFVFFICIASHCYVMSLLCLCAFVTLNKRLLTYLLTYSFKTRYRHV